MNNIGKFLSLFFEHIMAKKTFLFNIETPVGIRHRSGKFLNYCLPMPGRRFMIYRRFPCLLTRIIDIFTANANND